MAKRKSFLLRMDPRLWVELEAWSREEMRSDNGQIEYLLKQAVIKRKGEQAFAEEPQPKEDEEGS